MKRITTIRSLDGISLLRAFVELWLYRNLVWSFSRRDIKVKYFQTVFGPLWVVFSPLMTVGVMTFVFGLLVKIPSEGLPYLVFYLVAIIPWYSFIAVMNNSLSSLESHASLLHKIYFPRLVIPFSAMLNASVDFAVGYLIMVFFAWKYDLLTLSFFLVTPLLVVLQMCLAMGIGLSLAPYNAQYRDVKHLVPLFIQLFYFANPIVYPASVAPEWIRWVYQINPLSVIISSYRATLNGQGLNWVSLSQAALLTLSLFFLGVWLFLRQERRVVDVL